MKWTHRTMDLEFVILTIKVNLVITNLPMGIEVLAYLRRARKQNKNVIMVVHCTVDVSIMVVMPHSF